MSQSDERVGINYVCERGRKLAWVSVTLIHTRDFSALVGRGVYQGLGKHETFEWAHDDIQVPIIRPYKFIAHKKLVTTTQIMYSTVNSGYRGSSVVKVLCYKSEGRWFDPSWCHWNFSLT